MQDPRNFAMVWVQELLQEQKAVFGPDPWPYNLVGKHLWLVSDPKRTLLTGAWRSDTDVTGWVKRIAAHAGRTWGLAL